MIEKKTQNYLTQVCSALSEVTDQDWNELVADDARRRHSAQSSDVLATKPTLNPFLSHAWLSRLETSSSVGEGSGWQPAHLLTRDNLGQIQAALPLYLKYHSYGEYVFDWAWADAYERAGHAYFPKLLSAIPFTPVPGPRLIARSEAAVQATLDALEELAQRNNLSSIHLLYTDALDSGQLINRSDWLKREHVQFHWANQNWSTFDDFLNSLTQPKRKKIKAERRKFAESGLHCVRLVNQQISAEDWAFFYRCYCATYAAHHSTPYLTESFFEHLDRAVDCLLIKVMQGDRPLAASLCILSGTTEGARIYGRYWGAIEQLPFAHFEAAYYQPLEYAIAAKASVMEGGAQGEHKMARGFTPVGTSSWHWLGRPEFRNAVDRFLQRESAGIEAYVDELKDRQPYKK